MHHRHANTLMMLSSLLRREFALTTSPDLRDLLDRYEARIVAFGNFHRSLIVGTEDDWVSVDHYVEHLCEVLSEAILKPLGIRCEVFADAGEFAGDWCERLGLVITELVTNAAKHAFQGRIVALCELRLLTEATAGSASFPTMASGQGQHRLAWDRELSRNWCALWVENLR